jgi:3-phosphoshikimate 1-carboxyvinyltransferase
VIRTVRPGIVRGSVRAPPSKSYTHRALVLAALSGGREVRLVDPLRSEDTRATIRGIEALGARVRWVGDDLRVRPAVEIAPRRATVDCGESGTTLRFLLALAALGEQPVRFVGRGRLPRRTLGGLAEAIAEAGGSVVFERRDRTLPLVIRGPIRPGTYRLRANESSQPVSALLLTLPALGGDSRIREIGRPVSRPYVDATRYLLHSAGVRVARTRNGWRVPGGQRPSAASFRIPGDASSAAYLWGAAAITGGRVSVRGIPREAPQADLRILDWIERQGGRVDASSRSIRVQGPLRRGARMAFAACPDLFPLAAILAAGTAGGRSTLIAGSQLRGKESDRWVETRRLLSAFGVKGSVRGHSLSILGRGSLRAVRIASLTDHRLVMSAAVGALAGSEVSRLGRAEAVAKSFPEFWVRLGELLRPRGGRRTAPG